MHDVVGSSVRIATTFIALVILAALLALPAAAQKAEEPLTGFLFNATTELHYEDNVYRTRSDEQNDAIAVLKPELSWNEVWSASRLAVNYLGDFGRYHAESDLDYNNNSINAYLMLEHSTKLRSAFTLGHERKVDKPGTTDALSVQGERPDKWNNSEVGVTVDYGTAGSQGQLVLDTLYSERRYTNNDQEFRDYDGAGAMLTFYYRVTSATRLLLEADYIDYDFTEEDALGGDQSGDDAKLLAGLTWDVTAKTTGVFKIGYRSRNYDDARFSEQQGLALFLDASWRPDIHTTVIFGAGKDNQNSGQRGAGGSVRAYGYVAAIRDITDLTRFKVDFKFTNDEFENFANRKDKRWDAGVGLEYSLLNWLDVGVAYRVQNRESNVDIFDFRSNAIMLTATTRFPQ
ncbi:outer membrane beta-barrel protein [Candidatus Litorirhabdus singularis]|nr:outer membrane beta-barrel protein [Candidatus Litorirhabdus singularis]